LFQRLDMAWLDIMTIVRSSHLKRKVIPLLVESQRPRVAFVKQDVQDDLYCCPKTSTRADVIFSTLMRTGPVALFTRMGAEFLLVETEPDAECQAWAEKATDLHWYDLQALQQLRSSVPGRSHGQSAFAVRSDTVDWSQYDIVISLDTSIPARITRQYPNTLWCYYIREPKTRSYAASQTAPLPGQDRFLDQSFALRRTSSPRHVLKFPYYLQYFGCFHSLLERPTHDGSQRATIFLEHHTPETMSPDQLRQLAELGPVDSTAKESVENDSFASPNQKCRRSSQQIVSALLESKYFVACPKRRNLWGNAVIEAVSAGALVIGDPEVHIHRDVFSPGTSCRSFNELIQTLHHFESNPAAYQRELLRQRRMIDHLCFWRPVHELLQALQQHRRSR